MSSKRNLSRLIEEFLKTSPRNKAQKRNGILPPEHRMNLNKLPTDQQYIKNFIVHVQCSYMYNYYGPQPINEQSMYLHRKHFINPLSVGLVRRKAIEINDETLDKKAVLFELIKQLNKDKLTVLRYTEMQQFLIKLTIDETRQFKKFIVYLYKWLLNQKHKFQAGCIQQELCQQTSQLIIKKIYESHQKGDTQLLRNTEQELLTIETLEKARQQKRNGQFNEAKITYDNLYFGRVTQEIDRTEALEFLCEQCKVQKDHKYLQSMMQKMKQFNLNKAHEKVLSRAIKQIKEQIDAEMQSVTQEIINPLGKIQIDGEIGGKNEDEVGMGKVLLDTTMRGKQGSVMNGENKMKMENLKEQADPVKNG